MLRLISHIIRGEPLGHEPYVHLLVAWSDEEVTEPRRLVSTVRGFPLTWWTVWACVLLSLSLGAATAFSQTSRFSSHIFDGAKDALDFLPGDPMTAWGWIFLVGGAALAAATYFSPMAVVWVLRVIGTVYFIHASLIWRGAAGSAGAASYSGVPLCLFVTVIHLAAAQSIRMILRYRFPKGARP